MCNKVSSWQVVPAVAAGSSYHSRSSLCCKDGRRGSGAAAAASEVAVLPLVGLGLEVLDLHRSTGSWAR